MSLFVFSVHIIILVSLATQALIYSSFPTERDPITGQFVNEYLRFVEEWLFINSSYLFDSSGLLNRLYLFMLLRFLTVRIRALYIKIQSAKKNRYGYKSINIVDIEFCCVRAFHNRFKGIFRRGYESLTHDCYFKNSLTGDDRRVNLEFNKKVRQLDKMDRIYFYNQISFNKCYHKLDLFDKYYQDIKPIDTKLAKESINYSRLDGSGVMFEDDKLEVSWLQNLSCVDLSNRIGYLPPPENRADLGVGAAMLYLYLVVMAPTLLTIVSSAVVAMLGISNMSRSVVRIQPFVFTQTIKSLLMILCAVFTTCDNVQLEYSSLVAISRSYKIVELIKREIEFLRFHQRKFTPIYDKYFTNCVVEQAITSDEESETEEDSIDSNEYCMLLLAYKRCLPRVQVKEFNENLNYLLDLVEVLLIELEDHKSRFTTYLDINLIFGVVELSVALALILSTDNILNLSSASLCFIISGFSLFASLLTGAASELAVSLTLLYPLN